MDEEENVYDIGNNAKDTGFFYIFARYILPYIAAAFLIFFALLIFRDFFTAIVPRPYIQYANPY